MMAKCSLKPPGFLAIDSIFGGFRGVFRGYDRQGWLGGSRASSAVRIVWAMSIIFNGDIRITIVRIRGSHVRVGVDAPDSVPIFREELHDRAGRAAAHGHPASGEIEREPIGSPA
jgi:carbon storage regulator CsrA